MDKGNAVLFEVEKAKKKVSYRLISADPQSTQCLD